MDRDPCRRGDKFDSPDTLTLDKLGWDGELLRRQARLLNAPQGEFSQMTAKLLGKFACCGKSGMEQGTQRVVKSGNADVVRNKNARFLECLINAGSDFIRSGKKSGG